MKNNHFWQRFAGSALVLVLLAGCSKGGDDPAGTADGWRIPAGTYRSTDTGDTGFEVHLSEGDKSPIAALSLCRPECGTPIHSAVMRGLNGVSFSLSEAGHMVDVTLTPVSVSEILLAADWGQGLSGVTLRHVKPEAVNREQDGAAVSNDAAPNL